MKSKTESPTRLEQLWEETQAKFAEIDALRGEEIPKSEIDRRDYVRQLYTRISGPKCLCKSCADRRRAAR